jgi:peptidyl-prolyl cis-trans isomerase SurA
LVLALAASLALALGWSGWRTADWSAAAQSTPPKKLTAKAEPPDATSPAAVKAIRLIKVNDDVITAYDIEQRARFLGLGTDISEKAQENFKKLLKADSTEARLKELQAEVVRGNPGKSREELIAIFQERQKAFGMELQKQAVESARAVLLPKLKTIAKEELIDDRLKLQAAKKLGIDVPDDDVKAYLSDLAGKNKMTYEQFAKHLKGINVDIATMGDKFRAQKAWRDLISRRYGAQVAVTQRDIDKVLATAAIETGQDTVELQVHKISLGLSGRSDQAAWTRRYAEAEALRRRFGGCKSMGELAKNTPDSRFEDMKFIKPSSIAEPIRSLLLSAKDDDALPPLTTAAGVDLYAVCGRRSAAGNEGDRMKAMQVLQSKELDILARRHLRNLRQEANIEYK